MPADPASEVVDTSPEASTLERASIPENPTTPKQFNSAINLRLRAIRSVLMKERGLSPYIRQLYETAESRWSHVREHHDELGDEEVLSELQLIYEQVSGLKGVLEDSLFVGANRQDLDRAFGLLKDQLHALERSLKTREKAEVKAWFLIPSTLVFLMALFLPILFRSLPTELARDIRIGFDSVALLAVAALGCMLWSRSFMKEADRAAASIKAKANRLNIVVEAVSELHDHTPLGRLDRFEARVLLSRAEELLQEANEVLSHLKP